VLGDPLWVIAFGAAPDSAEIDIYQVMEYMSDRGWSLNGLQRPPAVHLAVTLRHTVPGVAARFLADLVGSVAQVRANPEVRTGMAPVYGMTGSLPDAAVRDLLGVYLDVLFEV
jgi:sphinganine-1-phosphate aldolase